jgi:hypothetical protein
VGSVVSLLLRVLFNQRICVASVRPSGEPTFPRLGLVLKWSSESQLSFLCYSTRNSARKGCMHSGWIPCWDCG